MIRFSIIIPVYKVEKYIAQCVDSILQQTYQNFEIILVDDGSPDKCPKICDEYAKKDNRVIVIHKENGGLSSARNAGLDRASGEYVMFLDSDDYHMNNNFLAVLNEEINAKSPDALFFQRIRFKQASQEYWIEPAPYPNEWKDFSTEEKLIAMSMEDKLDASAALKVTKREYLISEKLYFREGMFSEDIEWFFRYIQKIKSISLINEKSYCYRLRDDSISHTLKKKNLEDVFYSIKTYAEDIKNSNSSKKVALLNYMSYQYFIVLGLIFMVLKKSERKEFLAECRKYKWLIDYSISKKTKKASFLVRVFGVRVASFVLGKYIESK